MADPFVRALLTLALVTSAGCAQASGDASRSADTNADGQPSQDELRGGRSDCGGRR